MDLVELRILAAGGLVLVGVVVSALAVAAVIVAGWIDRLWHARAGGSVGAPAVRQASGLGAGRARC
jgi:hypothetical protein